MLQISEPRHLAELAVRIKEQFRKTLMVTPGYGHDKDFTAEAEALGSLIKELEDTVVLAILQDKSANMTEPVLKRRAHGE